MYSFHPRLTVQMESMVNSKSSSKQGPEASDSCSGQQQNDGLLSTELKIAQDELDTMARLNSRLGYEIKRNELALSNMMKNYDGRQQFARRLEADVNKVETSTSTGSINNSKKGLNKIEVIFEEFIMNASDLNLMKNPAFKRKQ